MNTITTAQSEYYRRPKDERMQSIGDLVARATHDRDLSGERTYNLKDLRAIAGKAITDGPADASTVVLEGPRGHASFSHWSFGQLARMIGAPAGYLRTLPAELIADNVNHGIKVSEPGTRATLLVQAPNGKPIAHVRSITSETYGRVWDAQLYGAINQTLIETSGGKWALPPTWDGEPAGAYRGDRDSFLIAVDGGSIVQDPSLAGRTVSGPGGSGDAGTLYRGIMVRNSEVGACSVSIERILFQYICGNHCLWGAVIDRKYRRRHTGDRVLGDTLREVADVARSWGARPASADEAIIRTLIANEIATTRDGVIDELRKLGATREQATAAYDTCEQQFRASPRSAWGIAQGLTRASQADGYQDERLQLDQLAGKLIAKYGQLQYA